MLSYAAAFKWVYTRLPGHRKKQFWILFAGMTSAAFLETAALGAVAFFASTVTDPRVVLDSRYIAGAREILSAMALPTGFLTTPNSLILATGLAMLFMITLKNSLKAIVEYWMARFGVGIEAFFGGWLLQGFLHRPYQWHLTCNTADLVNAVSWRTYLGRNFFQPCLKIFNSLLMVTIMVTALFVAQPAPATAGPTPMAFTDRIRFDHVSFAYQGTDTPVLHDLSFDIKKGETVGIIGASGAGKSTLVDLLIGLLHPIQGTITIDNTSLTPDKIARWLAVTGYVSQSPYIYDATHAENVAFGMDPKKIDRDQVKKCCTMASMDDFVHDLSQGIDSFIGSHLTETLLDMGCRVRASSLYNSFNDWGWLEVIKDRDNLEVVCGDVRDPHFCKEITKEIAAGKKQIQLGDVSPTRDFNYVLDTCQGFVDE